MDEVDKPIEWVGSCLEDLRAFPVAARTKLGTKLRALQSGVTPPNDVVALKGFGSANVREIKAQADGDAYRLVVTVEFDGVIYALHAFKKKSKSGIAIPTEHNDLIRNRLNAAREMHKARRR